MNGFPDALEVILQAEGGYVSDPKDPGGETNLGITWPTLRLAISRGLVDPAATIKALTHAQASAIYQSQYWDTVCGDALPYPVALVLFDGAVNHGPGIAVKWMQQALHVTADGHVGRDTLEAARKVGVIDLVRLMCKRRAMFYLQEEPPEIEERFELGWVNRLLDLEAAAIIAALMSDPKEGS